MTDIVHLYVFDGYADWEPAFAVAGIQSPDFQREPGRFRVQTVASAQGSVRSMGGVAVLPDGLLDAVDPRHSAMLILPGGPGWDQGEHLAAAEKARAFLEAGVPVAAICGATAGLARLGLLDDRPHTSNAAAYLRGTHYGGGSMYRDQAVVMDDTLITAGGMSPLEFARAIFARLGVYEDATLEAWYQLYKTGESWRFAEMASSSS
jgi:putative intracellular protease/amidase